MGLFLRILHKFYKNFQEIESEMTKNFTKIFAKNLVPRPRKFPKILQEFYKIFTESFVDPQNHEFFEDFRYFWKFFE